jgi:hypothetical protein
MAEYDFNYNPALSSSFQGQLASTYTNWLAGEVKAAADYIGFLVFEKALAGGASKADAVAAGQAAAAAVEAGNFTLTDLFGAAQSKTAAVPGSSITDPTPSLTVNGVTVSLAGMFDPADLTTETWTTTTKVGKTTETIYHTREFYDEASTPEYDLDWAVLNTAPTAVAIELDITEDAGPQNTDVDLLADAGIFDADGDEVTLVGGSLTFKINGVGATEAEALEYISIVDGKVTFLDDTLDLLSGQTLTIEIGYQITDGTDVVGNTATITYTGTADTYTGTDSIVVINGDAIPDSGSFEFPGTITDIAVSGTGDYDWFREGFNVTGDVTASYRGPNDSNSTGNNSPETTAPVSTGEVNATVNLSGLADGTLDYAVTFTNPTQNGSYVQIDLTYQYVA